MAVLTLTRGIRPGVEAVQLNDSLWRLTRPAGEVLGYVEKFTDHGADRFRSKRLVARGRQFLPIGEFWSMDDAVDCFRAN
jgi:hypothetical protein